MRIKFLKSEGLLNELFDYSELVKNTQKTIYAYCNSSICGAKHINGKYEGKTKIRKIVTGSPVDCPDCNHALFYTTKSPGYIL
jgi:predicted  nucleic acid-binding Zn-ribbon protein